MEDKSGNERQVVGFLIKNANKLTLRHIGLVKTIENPGPRGQLISIRSTRKLRTEDAGKKADIYINGYGVSIKQRGGNFAFNRLQRAELLDVFRQLGFKRPACILGKLDGLIRRFHNGEFDTRDRHWTEGFCEADFKRLLKYLMMRGSLNLGVSPHPAGCILTAPPKNITRANIICETFSEYFDRCKNKISLCLRRQWVGQASGEHWRACGMLNKKGNREWCFRKVVGSPRTWWRKGFPIKKRRTVYMIYTGVGL